MKIRSNFVANSSSTSFVVCIGEKEDLRQWFGDIKEEIKDWEKETREKVNGGLSGVVKELENLKKGDRVYEGGDWKTFRILTNLFDPDEKYRPAGARSYYTVDEFGTGSDMGFITNICSLDKYRKIKQLMKK